ncbi:hypothetical protein LTR10_016578 [Elasticomyces elasticus]|uniref:Uncharacterized protein n=1 Tax=Exophiala sideris TaxID=1016849 RepID=A0ABR0JJV1_9EURO|nr:hypothetical protein LTR10_016578 [Elasticomyces elasticus]KAK5035223.1 hypothetical protein LTS07_002659 [Exophiala sideris]KAK5039425.1 hypothetical protein LTR13_003682 [Exophiala sideris]KAK5066147.1 hypothetical protein LTR69_002665 [Exophiala sideris]KAK5186824.1 hypothetical protein LTR44_000830 [Eurotiomycetes sp. CCFEE 6388]
MNSSTTPNAPFAGLPNTAQGGGNGGSIISNLVQHGPALIQSIAPHFTGQSGGRTRAARYTSSDGNVMKVPVQLEQPYRRRSITNCPQAPDFVGGSIPWTLKPK